MSKKIFSISLEMNLDVIPNWLENFRKKYDHPYNYHIILKNKSYVDEIDLPEIKEKVEKIANDTKQMRISFDKIFSELSTKGWCIMIESNNDDSLKNFQKFISTEFSGYGEHADPKHAEYERNFHPHITIARKMDEETFEKAKDDLESDTHCEGIIDNLVLAVVDEDLSENWSDEKNRTIFNLKNT